MTKDMQENVALRKRIAELEEALKEARASLNDWGCYVDGYFKEKYHFEDDVARLDTAIAKAKASRGMNEWQSFETAPRDGSFFICWNGEDMKILNQPENCYLGEWYFIDGEWCGAFVRFDNPTHWMPLPEPPKEQP